MKKQKQGQLEVPGVCHNGVAYPKPLTKADLTVKFNMTAQNDALKNRAKATGQK